MKLIIKIALLLAIIISIPLLIYKFDLLKINKISYSLSGASCVSQSRLEQELKLNNSSFFGIDRKKLEEKIIQKYPCVKDAVVTTTFPSSMQISLTAREPFVCVKSLPNNQKLDLRVIEASPSSSSALLNWEVPTYSTSQCLIADRTGKIFTQQDGSNLNTLFLDQGNLVIGQQLDAKLFGNLAIISEQLVNLHNNTPDNNQPLVVFKVGYSVLQVLHKPRLVFSLNKDIFRQLAYLQLPFQLPKIDQKGLDTVDLRFDKPVITYSTK
ncbi:MAG: FtsQ-type POTRA domain-containing protein [Patescibacteria group bacterium]|nr:FtsQ-type POTRA domain-containing protein [Patescibacteria group bacterium]